jgi:DNA ligase 1
LTSLVSLKS